MNSAEVSAIARFMPPENPEFTSSLTGRTEKADFVSSTNLQELSSLAVSIDHFLKSRGREYNLVIASRCVHDPSDLFFESRLSIRNLSTTLRQLAELISESGQPPWCADVWVG